jgi:hypothetical protein
VAFVVPRPNGNSLAPAGNVIVDAALSHRKWDLKTYGDAKLRQEASGPAVPLSSTTGRGTRIGVEPFSRPVNSETRLMLCGINSPYATVSTSTFAPQYPSLTPTTRFGKHTTRRSLTA